MMQTPDDGNPKTNNRKVAIVSNGNNGNNVNNDDRDNTTDRPAPIGRRKQRSTAKVGS